MGRKKGQDSCFCFCPHVLSYGDTDMLLQGSRSMFFLQSLTCNSFSLPVTISSIRFQLGSQNKYQFQLGTIFLPFAFFCIQSHQSAELFSTIAGLSQHGGWFCICCSCITPAQSPESFTAFAFCFELKLIFMLSWAAQCLAFRAQRFP